MLRIKYLVYLVLITIFFSCSNQSSTPKFLLKTDHQHERVKLKLIDSIMIGGIANGFKEYIPLTLSPAKDKLLLMKARGGKRFFIVDLVKKNVKKYSLKKYSELGIGKVGIFNIGFVSDTIVAVFYRNRMGLINLKNRKFISKTMLPKGYYSSYTKKVITYITQDDTLYLSQLYSPKGSKYNNESDGFYDICPLSIYSAKRNKFLYIHLPKSSKFRTRNLGQPIVNFCNSGDTVYFSVSPENKLYSFIFDPNNFRITNFKTFSFNYPIADSLLSLKRSNFMKDLHRITTKNPYQSNIVKFNRKTFLSFSNGLSEKQYLRLYSNKMTEKERANFYADKRRSYVEMFDLNKRQDLGHTLLNKNIESIALKITDSTYFLKPKIAFYAQDTIVPLYIAKLQIIKND